MKSSGFHSFFAVFWGVPRRWDVHQVALTFWFSQNRDLGGQKTLSNYEPQKQNGCTPRGMSPEEQPRILRYTKKHTHTNTHTAKEEW